ncbi:uncharacterized protein DEA37_0002058 [Paragonimus westermani]|uniref:Reverse transcriptase/retrotransposon-derived protein RNase H-like domain-containing protein n=1 Tax=Paragonimus westermani TaxID=34504 RepID=A0A5J4NVZ4_9TREM|nr:uncharacterized protein DEA37_0002058 [Paragonimus westermani]
MEAPLQQLTEEGKKVVWSAECHAAFDTLEDKLGSPHILALPDVSLSAGPFILDTDASDLAIGAVLSQKSVNGHYKPTADVPTINYNQLKPDQTPEEAQMRPPPVSPDSVPIAEQTVEIPAEGGCNNIGGTKALR